MKKILLTFIAGATLASCGSNADKKKMDMDMDMPMEKEMKMEMIERTEGLVILGTTGMTEAYAKEQGGEYKGKISGAFTSASDFSKALTMEEMEMNAGFGGFAPEIAIVDGKTFRMVAPAIVKDNFVILNKDGSVCRYDLGVDEGTNEITLVGHWK